MDPIDRHLLPDSAAVTPAGRLTIAGCDAVELAHEFGTPLFVYDEEHLRARCREARAGFGKGAAYAAKAFLCVAMARLVHEEGLRIDVATGGEMHVALAAGVPAGRLILHGNNKSEPEIRRALDEGVGRIVIDSFDEIDRIEATAEGARPPRVLIRLNPGIEAHTHEYLKTGAADSKFGFGVDSGAAATAVERVMASPHMELMGIHAHIGSQVFETSFFERAVAGLAPFVERSGVGEFSVGGGLGVAYLAGEKAPSISQWAEVVHGACARAGISALVLAEPGRSIAAAAGVTLYTVGTIKDVSGIRTYVSVDGGMSDNPRPVLYGSGYEAFLPRSANAERPRSVRIVGKHCESGDIVVSHGAVPADIAVGDVLCTPVTGAYGYAMASNYNMVPRPAVVFVRDGRPRLVVRRETSDDLLARDVVD